MPTLAQTILSAAVRGADTGPRPPMQLSEPGSGRPVEPNHAVATAVGEIVVTAQKRLQSINSVGESVAAFSGDALTQRGIRTVGDLTKVVPGFVYTPTTYGTPVFILRGIGLYESGFGTSPDVAIYTDEIPVPYPLMQEGLTLDLARVEVVKGPQGTLYGENSTGGAINFIAEKPTRTLTSGGDVTVQRFGEVDLDAYVSGPIATDLLGRVALGTQQGGAWQQSASRPGDELGNKEFYNGRILLDWEPTAALSVKFNVNGFYDHDQNQAPQLKSFPASLLNPALPDPQANYVGNPNVPANIYTGPITPAEVPKVAPNDSRTADWSPDWGGDRRKNDYIQASAREDYRISGSLVLTSISSFGNVDINSYLPESGTALKIVDILSRGAVSTFNQELRLTGETPRLNWSSGLGYAYTNSIESQTFDLPGTLFSVFDFRGLDTIGLLPSSLANLYHLTEDTTTTRQIANDYSVFGNVEYRIIRGLSLQGGLRYSIDDRHSRTCEYYDGQANSSWGSVFEALQLLLGKGSYTPISQGQCFILNSTLNPSAVHEKLDQDNLSWRFGANYEVPSTDVLLYANVSRGFKAGEITNIGASSASQYTPVLQERLDAYEVGFKAPFLQNLYQLNGAAFYYDYKDKQIRGNEDDPVFGSLEELVNVPKSRILGLEGALDARPLKGLTIALAVTVMGSKVTSPFKLVTPDNVVGEFQGSQLPYTPHFTATGDIQYEWPLSDKYEAFVGASLLHHSTSNATFSSQISPSPDFSLPAYTTLDLRAGFGSADGSKTITFFGRNVTNTYYLTGNFSNGNERWVFTGLPVIYGATLSVRFR